MVNSGTSDLLLHILQCWRVCTVNEENQALPLVLYCSHTLYKHYSRLIFPPIKYNKERENIHNEVFNKISYFIKNCLHVDCLQDGFVVSNDKVILHKREVITPIPDSMIPVDFCQKN